MNIVVTGASGFLGSHLCDALVSSGHTVVGIDSNLIGRSANLDNVLGDPHFSFVLADVSAQGLNLSQFGKIDFVFHLASPTAPAETYRHPEATLAVNSQGVLRMMDVAERNRAGFMFASSVKVSDAETFSSEYIRGKRNGEQFTLSNPAFKVARFGNVYGPRMALNDSRVIPTWCRNAIQNRPIAIWGDGSQVDSFCYVSDAVRALTAFMESSEAGVMEFGNPDGISILDLAYTFCKALDQDIPIVFEQAGGAAVVLCNNASWANNRTCRALAAKQRKVPDISWARKRLKWTPKVSLEEGILQTHRYYALELAKEIAA